MAGFGCAQGLDGELLSPSKITWYNDVDDETPLQPNPSFTSVASSSTRSLSTLDSFLTSGNATVTPTEKVAGSRRSGRTLHPSARSLDPNNVESSLNVSGTIRKRKASSGQGAHYARKLVAVVDSDEDVPMDNVGSDSSAIDSMVATNIPSVVNTEEASSDGEGDELEDGYLHTKTLGDLDRKVHCFTFIAH
jgi:hypothetical protein